MTKRGYGPNLGPLLISATVWEVRDEPNLGEAAETSRREAVDLYERLAPAVTRTADTSADRLAIADSKALYQPSRGLAMLERGVLACVEQLGSGPFTWREIWQRLAPGAAEQRDGLPWYVGYDPAVPLAADAEDVLRVGEMLGRVLEERQVRLVAVRSRPVFPRRFNELVETCGTKAAALSELSVGLAGELIRELPPGRVEATFDRHGGRSRYAGLLQHEFPEGRLAIRHERREESRYGLRIEVRDNNLQEDDSVREIEARFCTGGERFLPAALASMVSKYLRELAMGAFNRFWSTHLPDLKPTAGYPQDARRFKAEIEATQKKLGIDDAVLWRMR